MKKADGADIVQGAFRRFWEGGESGVKSHHLTDMDQKSESFRFMGFYQDGHLSYNWGKLYRRSFLIENELWLRPYPFTQDKAHNFMCYARGARYAFMDESVYCYRVNESSVTFRYKKDFTDVWTAIGRDFCEWCDKDGFGDEYFDLVAYHEFFGAYFLVKQDLLARHERKARIKAQREYCSSAVCKKALLSLSHRDYVKNIPSLTWRVFIGLFSRVLYGGHYGLFDHFAVMFQSIGMDRIISKSEYRGE